MFIPFFNEFYFVQSILAQISVYLHYVFKVFGDKWDSGIELVVNDNVKYSCCEYLTLY